MEPERNGDTLDCGYPATAINLGSGALSYDRERLWFDCDSKGEPENWDHNATVTLLITVQNSGMQYAVSLTTAQARHIACELIAAAAFPQS